jgi:RNA polymerase sigma factor (sigma-70 family)
MLATCVNEEQNNKEDTGESEQPMSASMPMVDWTALVDQIRAGDQEGMAELYQLFAKGIRYYFYRHLGSQDLDDKIHDTFLIVVQAIKKGDLREPERLMGFVKTIVRRQVASHIEKAVHTRREETSLEPTTPLPDRKQSPEESAITGQQMEIVVRTLRGLSARDREILTRFYLHEQSQAQICREMRLSDTQFRLLKSRAKARFGEIGRRRMEKRPAQNIFMRVFSTFQH